MTELQRVYSQASGDARATVRKYAAAALDGDGILRRPGWGDISLLEPTLYHVMEHGGTLITTTGKRIKTNKLTKASITQAYWRNRKAILAAKEQTLELIANCTSRTQIRALDLYALINHAKSKPYRIL